MGIELDVKCDECNRKLSGSGETYCFDCFNELKEQIEEQSKIIDELNKQIDELERG